MKLERNTHGSLGAEKNCVHMCIGEKECVYMY